MWKPHAPSKRELLDSVLRTCVEMLGDRGYAITRAAADATPAIVALRDAIPGDNIVHVIFHEEDKIGVKSMRQMQLEMQTEGVDRIIVVSTEGPTPFTRRELGDLDCIEFFRFSELVLNVSKFAIVPRHTAVPEDEVPSLRRRFHIVSDNQWPKLMRCDAVCR